MTTTDTTLAPMLREPDGRPPVTVRSDVGGRLTLKPGWPLLVVFAGLPLWWVLGVLQLIFMVMSIPMLVYLVRLREVRAPRGLGLWLLFLLWLLGGLFTLQAAAPSTIPGYSGGRYVVFAYRGLWYIVGTIALLYVVNTKGFLSTQRICQALSWMFVTLVAGGLLGVLVPTLEFPSLLETVLPSVISGNGFVLSLIHPQVAQVQDFLGYVKPRPSAPFAFSNEWGLNLAMTVPFFVVVWWRKGRAYRAALPVVLALATIPIISSLNRGLWLALVAMALYAAVRFLLLGRVSVVIGLAAVTAIAAVFITASPLGGVLQDRLNTPHSNEGRANLSTLSVQSALQGSPVVGFGTTRDVQGNFNSIAGGASEQCPRCSPPPLGTQGQLWLLLFGAGVGGLVLYSLFFAGQFLRHMRGLSPYSLAAQCTLVALLVTMPVYNAVGLAVFVALVAVGVMAREHVLVSERAFGDLLDPARRNIGLILVISVLGTAVGAAVQRSLGSTATATQSVVLSPTDIFAIPGLRALSLDSEAQLVLSDTVVQAVRQTVNEDSTQNVVQAMSITAEPNTRILNVSYQAEDTQTAMIAVGQAVDTYLAYRKSLIAEAQESRADRLEGQQVALTGYSSLLTQTEAAAGRLVNPHLVETAARLRSTSRSSFGELSSLSGADTDPGQKVERITVRRPLDPWLIRLGSGFMLGLLSGLIISWYVDGRWSRLGTRPERSLGIDIPTVAQVRTSAHPDEFSATLLEAGRAVRAYRPLCGIIVDTDSKRACEVADALCRPLLSSAEDNNGSRTLIVVSDRSRPRNVRRMLRTCAVSGQRPVGLILAEEGRASIRS